MNEEVRVVDVARATGGNNQGGYQPIIDYNWIWYRTRDLCEIVNSTEIPDHDKGRSFGSGGEQNASEMIEQWMKDLGLENVTRDQISKRLTVWDARANEGFEDIAFRWGFGRQDRRWTLVNDTHWIWIRVINKSTGRIQPLYWTYHQEITPSIGMYS